MQITKLDTYKISDFNLRRVWEDIFKLTHRNISFGQQVDSGDQNIDGKMVEILDTGPANTQLTVIHNLNRVPNFIDMKYKNISGDWYDAGVVWTVTQVFLKFTIADMHVRLFIH